MPAKTQISDRIWFGIARWDGSSVAIEGAISPWPVGHDRAHLLILHEARPIGWLEVQAEEMTESIVLAHLATRAPDLLHQEHPEAPIGELTIAVCTRERADSLRMCLDRLRLSVNNCHEVLVIDNAPQTKETEQVVNSFSVDGMWIRRVVEDKRGLSRARNRALEEATTKYLAYTDDDALPDVGWASALLRGFLRGSNVALVTGIVPPAQIETRAQALFQRKVKWSRSLLPETYSMRRHKEHPYPFPFPFSAGHFGTGANFAVDRMAVRDVGGFDDALGAGTRAEGGEDIEMFVRILRRGFELVYQPSAIVWHMHRRETPTFAAFSSATGKGFPLPLLANSSILARSRCFEEP